MSYMNKNATIVGVTAMSVEYVVAIKIKLAFGKCESNLVPVINKIFPARATMRGSSL